MLFESNSNDADANGNGSRAQLRNILTALIAQFHGD
jgi:hypothetical protein